MADTLESLNLAVVVSPEDRTVRLVYADALDETGHSIDAARAEFIRAQIEVERITEPDFHRLAKQARARDLFDTHWLDWWRPVCAAAGLPEPHAPGRRRRDPIPVGTRRPRRSRNWPYSHSVDDTTIHLQAYGASVRFAGGFPEEVRLVTLDNPRNAPKLLHRWGNVMPLVRLAISHPLTPRQWKRVNGSHLSRLPELTFDRLPAQTTLAVASSPHLARLSRLSVYPVGATSAALGSLVAYPAWTELRTLRFTGPLSPEGVGAVAQRCTLEKLEELELTLGNPADPFGAMGAGSAVLSRVISVFMRAIEFPALAGFRWTEFGTALETLASARWVARLRRLRIVSGHHRGLGALLGRQMTGGTSERVADVIPDATVFSLADAVNRKGFERLTLPDVVISPSARDKLLKRFGSRVAFE